MAPPPRPPVGSVAGGGGEPELDTVGSVDPIVDAQGRKRCACGSWIKPISWNQHLKSYCPLRVFEATETRGGRKIIRPAPPPAPIDLARDADEAGKARPGLPKPYCHMRWAAPKIQPKRNATSIPGERGDSGPKAKKGPSQAPPPPATEEGCYGSCARCNQCTKCRMRICNGGCVGCRNQCRKCRTWGQRLAAGEMLATAKHAACLALPIVPKRVGPKDPGHKAKSAAAAAIDAARPKNAPAGSRQCPYCEKWMPRTHQENCQSMPYEYWIDATRQRIIGKHGQSVVDSWHVQCQHCSTPFISFASKRVHLSGCERRRNEAGLPLNSYPVVRNPS